MLGSRPGSDTISVPFSTSWLLLGPWDLIYKMRLLDSTFTRLFPDLKLLYYGREGVWSGINVIMSKEKYSKCLLIALIISFLWAAHFSSFLKLLCIYNKLFLYHIFTLPYPQPFEIKLPRHLQQSGSPRESTLLFVMISNHIFPKRPFSYEQNFLAGTFYSFRV